MRFETRSQLPEALLMEDPGFLAALQVLNPRIASGHNEQGGYETLMIVSAVVVGLIVMLGFGIWKAFPLLTGAMARMVPRSVEEKIGEAVLESMAPKEKRCADPSMQKLARALDRGGLGSSYRFRVYVAEDEMVNAFAAPGGYIVVYRGLLDKTKKSDQAAAVLAHEMQHVIQRHSVKGLMRGVSIWVALALLTGDPTSTIAALAGNLSSLHYMREDEASADREGLKMLARAGIDPMSMVRMLEILSQQEGDMPRAAQYFSSHPLTRDRIEAVRKLAEETDFRPVRVLSGAKWPPAPASCLNR